MGRFFDFEGPFFQAFEKIADIIILNIIFIICCLPVITIGASLTALSCITQKMARKEEGYIVRGFFSSFKRNFIQATVIWIILMIFGGVLYVDVRVISGTLSGVAFTMFTAFILLSGIVYLFVFMYVFPVLAKFDNTVINTMRNALILSFRCLPWTFLLILLTAVPLIAGYFYMQIAIPVYIFAGFSLTSLAASHIFKKIFDPLITNG